VGAGGAPSSTTQETIRAALQMMRATLQWTIDNVAGSGCATVVFAIHSLDDRRDIEDVAHHQNRANWRCADSESRFLAIKKFSRSAASRLIVARQNRFFARIARG
jgi:hypothetical protein